MDQALTQNATRTFWKSSYAKHSLFALESITQEFDNNFVKFGQKNTCTVQRQGDLLSWMYVRFDVPAIQAVDRDESFSSQRSYDTGTAVDQISADLEPVLDLLPDGYTEASIPKKAYLMHKATNEYHGRTHGTAPLPPGDADAQSGKTTFSDSSYCYWTEALGFYLCEEVDLEIGGAIVDSLWSELLFAMEELMGRAGRRLTETVGRTLRSPVQLMKASRSAQVLYVPLPWYFTRHPSLAFPLVAASYHQMKIKIKAPTLSSCIIKSSANVDVYNFNTGNKIGMDNSHNDVGISLECTYVHLEAAERDALTGNASTQLIIGHQRQEFNGPSITGTGSNERTVDLNFNFPIIELYFMFRRSSNQLLADHFNFSGLMGKDPISEASLLFNNTPRVTTKPAIWWRCVQALQFHSSVPLSHVYSYSFSLAPEDPVTPSGSANFSRLDSVKLKYRLQTDAFRAQADQNSHLLVFARSYNILKFSNGLCGLLYSN